MWRRNRDLPVPLCRRRGSLECCSACRFVVEKREKKSKKQAQACGSAGIGHVDLPEVRRKVIRIFQQSIL